MDCSSSLVDLSSSLDVSSSSTVLCKVSLAYWSSCSKSRIRPGGALAERPAGLRAGSRFSRGRLGLKRHQQQAADGFRLAQLRHRQPDGDGIPVGLHAHAFMDDRGVLAGGPAQGGGEVNPQALARHVQDVQARLAGGRFEVIPGAPVDVEDVTPVVDDDTGRGIAIQQGLFEQDRELQLLGAAGGLSCRRGDRPPAGARPPRTAPPAARLRPALCA